MPITCLNNLDSKQVESLTLNDSTDKYSFYQCLTCSLNITRHFRFVLLFICNVLAVWQWSLRDRLSVTVMHLIFCCVIKLNAC